MNKFGKIIIVSVMVILSICTILLRQGLAIKENIYVVSKSEDESVDTPKNINREVNKEEYEFKKIEKENNKNMITIFISGEVKKPGVVTIEGNKRLSDAIDKLGGFTSEADLNKINLAMRIEDESHYIIPRIGDNTETDNALTDININKTINNDNQSKTPKININIASIQELDTLPGIGEAIANKIINYREEKGAFNTIEAIKNVNGIGDKKYEDIKDMISIN